MHRRWPFSGSRTPKRSPSGALNGVISGDSVDFSHGSASFDNRNAGIAKTVALAGVVLGGTEAGNYSIASTATTVADITPKALTLSGLDAQSKVYDTYKGLSLDQLPAAKGDGVDAAIMAAVKKAGTMVYVRLKHA